MDYLEYNPLVLIGVSFFLPPLLLLLSRENFCVFGQLLKFFTIISFPLYNRNFFRVLSHTFRKFHNIFIFAFFYYISRTFFSFRFIFCKKFNISPIYLLVVAIVAHRNPKVNYYGKTFDLLSRSFFIAQNFFLVSVYFR